MQKLKLLILQLFFFFFFAATAFPECRTTKNTLFFTDIETFQEIDRVLAVSRDQGFALVGKKIDEGKVIRAKKGLSVNKLEKVNNLLVVVETRNYPYITFEKDLDCD